jgi:hypothetical protein
MVHSIESEFTEGSPRAFRTSHSVRQASHPQGTHDRSRAAHALWFHPSFAEPEINPLWDTGLLDRLSSPLTRYHE